jgi:ketosteroid isomerase-like protein
LADLFQKTFEIVKTSFPEPSEFVAQGDRVLVLGVSRGRVNATNKTFEDHFVFAITVRDGKLTNIRAYIDTEGLARAVSPGPLPIEANTT